MTNYNERLDEILTTCDFEPEGFNSRICKWCGERKGMKIHTAKQDITSLIKKLVAEAKPERQPPMKMGSPTKESSDLDKMIFAKKKGHNEAIDQFEQNLLKALENK